MSDSRIGAFATSAPGTYGALSPRHQQDMDDRTLANAAGKSMNEMTHYELSVHATQSDHAPTRRQAKGEIDRRARNAGKYRAPIR